MADGLKWGRKYHYYIVSVTLLGQMVVLTVPLVVLPRASMYSGTEICLGLGMAAVCLTHLYKDSDTCVLQVSRLAQFYIRSHQVNDPQDPLDHQP